MKVILKQDIKGKGKKGQMIEASTAMPLGIRKLRA